MSPVWDLGAGLRRGVGAACQVERVGALLGTGSHADVSALALVTCVPLGLLACLPPACLPPRLPGLLVLIPASSPSALPGCCLPLPDDACCCRCHRPPAAPAVPAATCFRLLLSPQAAGLALPGSDLDLVVLGAQLPSFTGAAEGFGKGKVGWDGHGHLGGWDGLGR